MPHVAEDYKRCRLMEYLENIEGWCSSARGSICASKKNLCPYIYAIYAYSIYSRVEMY